MAQRTSKNTLADSGQLRKRYGRERRASRSKHDALPCRAGLEISERLPVLGQGPDLGPGVHDRPADPTLFVDQETPTYSSAVLLIEHPVAAAHLAMRPEISQQGKPILLLLVEHCQCRQRICRDAVQLDAICFEQLEVDRKSTRLNSSHVATSYAVFCLRQKQNI